VVADGVAVVAVGVGIVMVVNFLFCVEQRVNMRPMLKHTETFYRCEGGGVKSMSLRTFWISRTLLRISQISVIKELAQFR